MEITVLCQALGREIRSYLNNRLELTPGRETVLGDGQLVKVVLSSHL